MGIVIEIDCRERDAGIPEKPSITKDVVAENNTYLLVIIALISVLILNKRQIGTLLNPF